MKSEKLKVWSLIIFLILVIIFLMFLKIGIIRDSHHIFEITALLVIAFWCLYKAINGLKTGKIDLGGRWMPAYILKNRKYASSDASYKFIQLMTIYPASRQKDPFDYWARICLCFTLFFVLSGLAVFILVL